ncbi:TetR/AcrR family transcriptional regulator [Actinomadura terrae]|uniref:TetR/AcrR family transcriptional regulator n=1 Tax=Actinomadura terrae TaxID=604353 RepID=UPI001FA7A54E|nr:TetR/AcrR family transcriptional regulator [Actinomadura terrae]
MADGSVTSTRAGRRMRADARRNRDRILGAAVSAVAEHGAEASLEEIARRAGVGSATLHRHFSSRRALLDAVFQDAAEDLCAAARDLATAPDPAGALDAWLRAVARHAASSRGLAASLIPGGHDVCGASVHDKIVTAGEGLLARARAARAVRSDIVIMDLLMLVTGICLITERRPDGAAEADRLLGIALGGIHPAIPDADAT